MIISKFYVSKLTASCMFVINATCRLVALYFGTLNLVLPGFFWVFIPTKSGLKLKSPVATLAIAVLAMALCRL